MADAQFTETYPARWQYYDAALGHIDAPVTVLYKPTINGLNMSLTVLCFVKPIDKMRFINGNLANGNIINIPLDEIAAVNEDCDAKLLAK